MTNEPFLNKHVLIAEDNAVNQMIVAHTLQKLGASTTVVNNGLEAIASLEKNQFDLILMDLQMPMKNGYEATSFIRNEMLNQVPIVAMTAFAQKTEEQKCKDCGIVAYLSKPFTTEELQNVVESALGAPLPTLNDSKKLSKNDVVIDLEFLHEISAGDETFIKTMLQTFADTLPETFKKIETSLDSKNWHEVSRTAHYAKSSLSVIKVGVLYNLMLQIETDARHQTNLSNIPSSLKKAQQALKVVLQLLKTNFNLQVQSL